MVRTLSVFAFSLALCAAAPAQQLPGVTTGAGPKSTPDAATPATEAEIKAKLAAAQAELQRFTADRASKAPPGAPEQEVIEYRTLLGILAGSYHVEVVSRAEPQLVARQSRG